MGLNATCRVGFIYPTRLIAHTQGRSTRATGSCDIWLCSYGIYLNNCFRYRSGVVPVCCLKK